MNEKATVGSIVGRPTRRPCGPFVSNVSTLENLDRVRSTTHARSCNSLIIVGCPTNGVAVGIEGGRTFEKRFTFAKRNPRSLRLGGRERSCKVTLEVNTFAVGMIFLPLFYHLVVLKHVVNRLVQVTMSFVGRADYHSAALKLQYSFLGVGHPMVFEGYYVTHLNICPLSLHQVAMYSPSS